MGIGDKGYETILADEALLDGDSGGGAHGGALQHSCSCSPRRINTTVLERSRREHENNGWRELLSL